MPGPRPRHDVDETASHDPVVAVDAGPLHGARTGVGNAVASTIDALRDLDVSLSPYVTSTRARLRAGEHRLPLPAAVAHRIWARSSAIPMDRWLGWPDVVHGTNYVVPPARVPRLVSVYDCWFLEHPADAHPDVRRAAAVLKHAVDDGAHVVASSRSTAVRVSELLRTERVHMIHLGPPPPLVDAGRPPLWMDPDHPFVLALGTIERRKNLPTLVKAFARLAREHETVRLVIAGAPGDDIAALDAAIERTRLAGRVATPGAVSDDEKRWLLANAAALAYPSLDEGFGFPILEAQVAGTPVVASSAGSIPEVAGSAALLSLPTDDLALAANLAWVLNDDDRCATLIEAGRRNVERFSWQRTATELAALYRNLANGA